MPHYGTAKKAGTTHQAVSEHDDGLRGAAQPGDTLSAEQLSQHSQKNYALTAKGPGLDDVSQKGRGPKMVRTNELKARKASAESLAPTSAGSAEAPAATDVADESSGKAAKCIEDFTEAATEEMRAKVMQDYGPENYEKTQARLDKEEAAALKKKQEALAKRDQATADKKAAEERIQKAKEDAEKVKGDPEATKALEKSIKQDEAARKKAANDEREGYEAVAQASQDHREAKGAKDSAHCLKSQAEQLEKLKPPPFPKMSGSVPPGPGQSWPSPGKGPETDDTHIGGDF